MDIMINANKLKPIGQDYRNNVRACSFPCEAIIENSFQTEFSPEHFVSVHRAPSGALAEVLHIVVNRQPAFAVKQLLSQAKELQ